MMYMRILILMFLVFFFSGCDPENKNRKKIESLQKDEQVRKYEVGIACMEYISRYGDDLAYSKSLVSKLLDLGFSAEALNAVELLQEKFSDDPELFYLRGLAYRNQHWYGHALKNFEFALKSQPQNNNFITALRSTSEDQARWNEILTLNETLATASDSFEILLQRGEIFFAMRQYDAALYDLGAISRMGTVADSVYFTQMVSTIYKDSQAPVKRLSEMLVYFRALHQKK